MSNLYSDKLTCCTNCGGIVECNCPQSDHFPLGPRTVTYLLRVSTRSGFGHVPVARCSSMATAFAHGAMNRRIDPSWCYFLFQPGFHDWCNKGRVICYPVCGMMHIKEPLLLIGNSSPCGFVSRYLNGPLPYV